MTKRATRKGSTVGIQRGTTWSDEVNVSNVEADCEYIIIDGSSALLVMPKSGGVSSLTPYVANEPEGPWMPLFAAADATGSSFAQVALAGLGIGNAYEVPLALFPARYVKFLSVGPGVIGFSAKE